MDGRKSIRILPLLLAFRCEVSFKRREWRERGGRRGGFGERENEESTSIAQPLRDEFIF